MKEKNGSTQNLNIEPEENLSEILDKLLVLQEQAKEPSFLRKTIYVVAGIISLIFVGLLCVTIYKNSFSVESILSTLLAFFSIFISVFFYFKADETSTNFYTSSYEFMKDISVTLGKIEERFGEKLNSLNDKIAHLDNESFEKSAEIEDEKENKENIINELMNKANLNEEERAKYKKDIEEKEKIIEQLKRERYQVQREANRLRTKTRSEMLDERWAPDRALLLELLTNGTNNIPMRSYNKLRRWGLLDAEGVVNRDQVLEQLAYLSN